MKIIKSVKPSIIVISLFLIIVISCKSPFQNKITEGCIQYNIIYDYPTGKNFPMQLLPKTMEFKFNKNYASYSLQDRVGLFAISVIINLKQHKHVTMIKVFDKKYLYQSAKKETPIFFNPETKYKIKFCKDTFRLAGLLCRNENVTECNTNKIFTVAYTMIDVNDPNIGTPYEKINGLLMDFILQMKNLNMKLTATKVEEKIINEEEFRIPEGYKLISKRQMEDIITTLLP